MAKKKTTKAPKSKIDMIIIICTVVIIALIAGIVSLTIYNNKKDEVPEKISMLDVIKELNIKENPVATIEMKDGGKMIVELYPEIAPNTVCNFIELANSGYYDGLIFHRCIEDFMIQGGDPQGTGMGGPGYSIAGEFTDNGFTNDLSHDTGVISMARGAYDYDSAGSQFFIMISDTHKPALDGQYASFGKVISGMEVADAIVANETDENDKPLVDQVIKSIRVDTKGVTYPEAEKIK